jgi:undecaprenyl-diphosphatase
MNHLQAFLFGLLQGVTEFLPVSSSGHLAVMKVLFGLREVPVLFDVLLHIATLIVVCFVFRTKIGELTGGLIRFVMRKSRPEDKPLLRLTAVLLVATVCTGILGLLIKDLGVEGHPKAVSALFIVTGTLLFLSRRAGGAKGYGDLGLKEGLLTGLAQGIGVLPGISRSGITISAALFAGMGRKEAGEYSFLLFIPAAVGAFLLSLKDAAKLREIVPLDVLSLGFVTSMAVGFLSLTLLLKLVRQGKLAWFALYLIPLGVWGLIFL